MTPKTNSTLADQVELRLLEFLRTNEVKPGDILPRETDLVEKLHISRHIIREGLSRLKAMGLVEPLKRRGTVFCRPRAFLGFQKLAEAGMFTPADQRHFMELRVAMEIGMTDFIYARRTPEKLAKLRTLAGEAGEAVHSLDNELDFHSCLMSFSENSAAEGFRRVLTLAFGTIRPDNNRPGPIVTHQDICKALEHGTVDSFREILRQHFLRYILYTTE